MDDSLIVSKGSLIEPENNDAFSKSEIETHMQRQEEKVDMRVKQFDAGVVVTESNIRPVIDEEPFAEVHVNPLKEKDSEFGYKKMYILLLQVFKEFKSDEHCFKRHWIKIASNEAEEEAIAREVHATHARIVSESKPEPTQRRQSGYSNYYSAKQRGCWTFNESSSRKQGKNEQETALDLVEWRLKGSNEGNGVPDAEKAHEAKAGSNPEPMQEDQTGSDSGKLHVSLAGQNPEHIDDEFLVVAYPKVHENLKLITDERVIEDNSESQYGSMSSMKNLKDTDNFGDQFLYDKPTEDDQEKSKVIEESDSTIPDPSHQTVTSTPLVIAPFTDFSSRKPSSLVTPPPINTEATTITTSLPEITSFIALQLRVARLEQEMSEVKKTVHSADVVTLIRSHVPTAVDKYLGTKLDDVLLKVLE
ncbi:hypothetical protein Tco_0641324 [Tanacetum coccineum]